MSIRSASANGSRRSAGPPRTAFGGSRPRPTTQAGDRKSLVSASQLPSLGIDGKSYQKQQPSLGNSKPPLGMSASTRGFNSRRLGNPDAKEDKNTAVITIDDLQRLREQVALGGARSDLEIDAEIRAKEKQELYNRSRQRIKNWPNTIENLRNKRIEEKYRKLEEAELERRRVDAEEDAYQQELRMQALEAANKKMHDSQDVVKAFHTKMYLCDVLQEREAQIDLKKQREEHEKAIEDGWLENDQIKMEEYDKRMQQRIEELYKRKQETSKVVKQQLADFKQSYIKRIKEEMLEGELVKRKAREELELERLKELERRKLQAKTREELKKANEDLRLYNEELKRKEKEEERKLEEYAVKKERLDQLKKDREEQRFKEKQKVRERMIERQAEYLAQLQNREEEILNKQVAEAEEKAKKLFEEAEAKRLQLKEQIEKSRKNQIEKRRTEKENNLKEEREFTEFWRARNDELCVAENIEKDEIRQRQAELKQYQKQQADNRKKQAEEDFVRELHQATSSQALIDHKEKEFYSYAERCIKEWQDAGKNVKPLILELKNYKKKAF